MPIHFFLINSDIPNKSQLKSTIPSGSKSILIPNVNNSKIFTWSYLCLEDLVMSPFNSLKGISLAVETPYGTHLINILRRAVLRQYYGRDVIALSNNNKRMRFTYGNNKKNSSVNTDSMNFVTKPFNYYLHRCL